MPPAVGIALGVIMLVGAPIMFFGRRNPRNQFISGLNRIPYWRIGEPRTPAQLARRSVYAVVLGIALIVYSVTKL